VKWFPCQPSEFCDFAILSKEKKYYNNNNNTSIIIQLCHGQCVYNELFNALEWLTDCCAYKTNPIFKLGKVHVWL